MSILRTISSTNLIISLVIDIIDNQIAGDRSSGPLFAIVYAGIYGIFLALFMNKLLTNSE